MREGIEPGTPPQDTGPPDEVERDPAALNSAEDLDEDRLDFDPERDDEPSAEFARRQRYGTTPFEQSQGEDLDNRLSQERPDVQPEDDPEDGLDQT